VHVRLDEDDERMTADSVSAGLLRKLCEGKGKTSLISIHAHICCNDQHWGTLHHQAKRRFLSTVEVWHLRDYLEGIGHNNRVAAPLSVQVWKQCQLNDFSVSQGLYREYIRSAEFEKANARDSTHIKFKVA
jgi:hypothetical protein